MTECLLIHLVLARDGNCQDSVPQPLCAWWDLNLASDFVANAMHEQRNRVRYNGSTDCTIYSVVSVPAMQEARFER